MASHSEWSAATTHSSAARWLWGYAVTGSLLGVAAAVGLSVWAQADWFHDASGSYPTGPYPVGWKGYTRSQFIGLVAFTFATPAGFTLLLVAVQQALRRTKGLAHVGISITTVCTLILLAALGTLWAAPTLKCAAVACLDPSVYSDTHSAVGLGWQSTLGSEVLLSAAPIACAFAFRLFISMRVRAPAKDTLLEAVDDDPARSVPLAGSTRWNDCTVRGWVWYALLLPLFLGFGFVTTYVPNNWEYGTADRIATFAAKSVEHDPNKFNSQTDMEIPEYPHATFWTHQIQLKRYWILKLFPDNLFYYMFLCVAPLVTLIANSFKYTRRLLARQICRPVDSQPAMTGILRALGMHRIGATGLALTCGTGALIILWCYYWFHDHIFDGLWPPDPAQPLFNSQRICRAFGQLSVLLISLLMFPVARNSVLPYMFGRSWEILLGAHILLGRLFLAATVAHVVGAYWWYADSGALEDVFEIPLKLPSAVDNFTVPLMSLVMWPSFLTMGVFTLWTIRRKYFELFYYSHHITYCLLIPSTLWHATGSWQFLLPPVALWFADRLIRLYRSAKKVEVIHATAHQVGATTVVGIKLKADLEYSPGQYCFINVPEVSLMQWHPFTIAGCQPGEIELFIKPTGTGQSFTNQLFQQIQAGQPITVCVDGPNGLPLDYYSRSHIFLVAGGVGITPCRSILNALVAHREQLHSLQRLVLVWAVRGGEMFEIIDTSTGLQKIDDCRFSALLFDTSRKVSDPDQQQNPLDTLELGIQPRAPDKGQVVRRDGRPNLQELNELLTNANDDALLFTCGPSPLVEECQTLAHLRGWECHAETFEF